MVATPRRGCRSPHGFAGYVLNGEETVLSGRRETTTLVLFIEMGKTAELLFDTARISSTGEGALYSFPLYPSGNRRTVTGSIVGIRFARSQQRRSRHDFL